MKVKALLSVSWFCVALTCAAAEKPAGGAPASQVKNLKITILSTMLADKGIGEWGFAALLETDGHKLLIDTGARPTTVLSNAVELGVDLADVNEVVLTHNHDDHTGGLLTLRGQFMNKNPKALSIAHVGKGIFYSRPESDGSEGNTMITTRKGFEALGGKFVEHETWAELFPGVWLTGPVPRVHSEKNWSLLGKVRSPEGLIEDNVPEDSSVVILTAKGLVLITGCGHAGIINILTDVTKRFPEQSLYALIGGIHLFNAPEERVNWTADKLKAAGLVNFVGAHCTGINTVYLMRDRMGLSRQTAVVGAVGASFDLSKGIQPGNIAQ